VNGSAQASLVIRIKAAGPYEGQAHLGEWVWVAITKYGTEYFGTVNYTTFHGSPTPESREIIRGTWDNCTFGVCSTIGNALMGELYSTVSGWEHSSAFFNSSGDMRLLAFEFEPFTAEDGSRGYVGAGEFYGSAAGVAIVRMGPAASSALEAGFGTLALQHRDADWKRAS
jgi:hypothetical protein